MPEPLVRHHLRHAIVLVLVGTKRATSVAEIVERLHASGYELRGRPTQAVSDALRTEMRNGRVARVGRGRYMIDHLTDRQLRYSRQRVLEFRRKHQGAI